MIKPCIVYKDQAEEAMNFYVSIFPNSKIVSIQRSETDGPVAKGKVLGYTIEWGPQRDSIPKSFHPDYADMAPIIEEVTAALLAFCSELAGRRAAPRGNGLGGEAAAAHIASSGTSDGRS